MKTTSLYARRRMRNTLALAFSAAAAFAGLACLGSILFTLISNGAAGMNLAVFTQSTPPPGQAGGLLNAIAGSIAMTGLAVLIGAPTGVMAGIYMAEYGRGTRLATVIRFVNDILLSAPSIVVGLFIYVIMVAPMQHFSGFAGIAALVLIALPIVVRTSEDMLLLVPDSLREAAAALGAPRSVVVRRIVYRAARTGIVTGILLAIARVSGETAPLLFTALNNQFWSTNLNMPIASLPVVIFQYALSPYLAWQQLAWAGALLITALVFAISISARAIAAPEARK
jgi:phosphate transport system permease protein